MESVSMSKRILSGVYFLISITVILAILGSIFITYNTEFPFFINITFGGLLVYSAKMLLGILSIGLYLSIFIWIADYIDRTYFVGSRKAYRPLIGFTIMWSFVIYIGVAVIRIVSQANVIAGISTMILGLIGISSYIYSTVLPEIREIRLLVKNPELWDLRLKLDGLIEEINDIDYNKIDSLAGYDEYRELIIDKTNAEIEYTQAKKILIDNEYN